ncbi:MAG TPA: PEP-CTERM sorting domain-containing protein [Vicinamibacterales bacterium]|nr:PEP-CTERM sorting domain-containing protein [Vicinamibacterales bacterium]
MRRILQLIAWLTAVWLAAPPTVAADPIAITSGVITLPSSVEAAPITLAGTDGARMFTFAGTLSDIDPAPYSCHPCVSQIGIDINAPGAAHGTLTYGNESYQTGGGFLDTEGALVLFVQGGPILLPAPLALGEIRSFSAPFTASGRVVPPFIPGDGLSNTLTGSGIATVTLSGGPGNEMNPLVWDFRRAEYRFSAVSGGPAPIPEPASFLLIASGLSALVLKRRSRTV